MILTFPQGQEVNVEFDDAAHSYVIAHKLYDGTFSDFRPTHGITAPLEVVPKPFLKPWASKVAVNAVLEHFYQHPSTIDELPQFFEDLAKYESKAKNDKGKTAVTHYYMQKHYPWYSACKQAYKRKSTEGTDTGSWLHEAIELYYKSDRQQLPIITPDVEGLWDSFMQFDTFFRPTPDPDGLEFLVYSLLFGFSGQGDFRGQIMNKYVYLDWKTTNRSDVNSDGISVDYFFQGGGIAQAEYERTGRWFDDIGIVNIDKKGGEPRIIWASEFGMAPQDAAKAYISCFNNYHMINTWDYKFKKR